MKRSLPEQHLFKKKTHDFDYDPDDDGGYNVSYQSFPVLLHGVLLRFEGSRAADFMQGKSVLEMSISCNQHVFERQRYRRAYSKGRRLSETSSVCSTRPGLLRVELV